MNIVRIGWPADTVPQNLEDVLDALCVVDVDICNIVVAGGAAALESELQVAVPIQGLEAVGDLIAGYWIVKLGRDTVKQR